MDELSERAVALAASVAYRSAGTVEFVHDIERGETSFLEVNTRLQVEHPVTEAVLGIDLVEWMVRLAGGDATMLAEPRARSGHAVEVRVYAEDAARGHRPDAGVLTEVVFPTPDDAVRVDTWVETGTDVTPHYDPLLAKVITHGPDRAAALDRMVAALDGTRLSRHRDQHRVRGWAPADRSGPDGHLRHRHPRRVLPPAAGHRGRAGRPAHHGAGPARTTGLLARGRAAERADGRPLVRARQRVARQPGRRGRPRDHPRRAGPALPPARGRVPHRCAPAGDAVGATRCRSGSRSTCRPAGCSTSAPPPGPGLRSYLLVGGGHRRARLPRQPLDLHARRLRRPRRPGPAVRRRAAARRSGGRPTPVPVPLVDRPVLSSSWRIGVLEGPHTAPEFFTPGDLDILYATEWQVHHNSSRTGVRLIGPKPTWARPDGGEAGLHPSNIHDTAYAVGTVDFTGDMPILLGPDGPSLGGFVCPATVVEGERWKLGQLRPGDTRAVRPARPDHRRGPPHLQQPDDRAPPPPRSRGRGAGPPRWWRRTSRGLLPPLRRLVPAGRVRAR